MKKRLSGGRIDVSTGTLPPVDRIVVGKQVRALRELSSLDKLEPSGELLTFRAVLGGKKVQCRADVSVTFATCR